MRFDLRNYVPMDLDEIVMFLFVPGRTLAEIDGDVDPLMVCSVTNVVSYDLPGVVGSSGLVADEVRYSLPSFGWRNRHARYSEEHIALAKRG
jgi:hypothetical protein